MLPHIGVWQDSWRTSRTLGQPLSLLLFLVPLGVYQGWVSFGGADVDPLSVGKYVSFGFIFVCVGAWTASYLFRVARKETVYSRQLREYEDGVIAERMREIEGMSEGERERILGKGEGE